MQPSELRTKTREELLGIEEAKKADLARLKFRQAMGQLEKTADLKALRRDIARIKTVMREKGSKKAKNAKAN